MANSSIPVPTMQTNDEEEDLNHYVSAVTIIQAGFLPMLLNSAVELDLLGIIARAGPGCMLTAKEIASQVTGCSNPNAPAMLDRALRLLATHSIVNCSTDDGGSERRYGLSPVAKFFVPDENGASLGPLLALKVDPVIQTTWSKLKEAVLEGGVPFDMVHGVNAYDYPSFDPRYNQVFNKAMSSQSSFLINKIVQKYKGFEGIKQLVDVGGGHGRILCGIISKYPTIKGINFDLPHVILHAIPYPGVEHRSGDMFESVPQGDAMFMKWVLQIWDDDHCLRVLKNCYKAMPKDGKVIIVEEIMTEKPKSTIVEKAIIEKDVYHMTKNPGGKQRTANEFLALGRAAGFTGIRVDCQLGHQSVLELYK